MKELQARLGLTTGHMARYLGVPVFTLRHWLGGTREPGAATWRLVEVFEMIEKQAPELHARLVADACADPIELPAWLSL